MTISIHAEIDPDGQRLVLLAVGPVHLVAGAAKTVQTLTPLFTKSDPPGALVAPLTWTAVVQLQAAFSDAWRPGPALCAWISAQVAARTTPDAITYTPPSPLVPYPWQLEGAAMIAATGRALITDEPGTGKTITTILGLVQWAAERHAEGPALVICPASVVDAWVDAWRTWAPHVRAVAWRGTPAKRRALLGTADVYVTSYDLARTDAPPTTARKLAPLRELGANAVVVDECHLIKNNQTARSQAVRRLTKAAAEQVGAPGAVVCLSGTPITHHPGDLWATLNALEHDATPSRERWVQRYCAVLTGEYRDEVLGLATHAEPEFRLTMLGQHRRVAKADVLGQLPPKVYSVRTVDMPKAWRKVYDDFEAEMLAEMPDGSELQVMDVMSKFGHLSRLAATAADVRVEHGPDVDEQTGLPKRHVHLDLKAGHVNGVSQQWKIDALLEVLDERCSLNDSADQRQQVVVFAPSSQLMKLAGAAATQAGYRVGYVIGGQAAADRSAQVAAFQAGELDLICVTTGAGGVGITLTAARTVVFLQRPWSIVESIQAEDRCHRIGSERHDSIEVIDVVARNTIDTRVRDVLRERAGQLADLVQDPRLVAELLGGITTKEHAA